MGIGTLEVPNALSTGDELGEEWDDGELEDGALDDGFGTVVDGCVGLDGTLGEGEVL